MAQLVVRGLDDDVKELLRARATANHRSLEAEIRDILTSAVVPDVSPLAAIRAAVAEHGGFDAELPPRADYPHPIDFS